MEILQAINAPMAYIGPGAGMGMLMSLLALVAAIGTALFTVALWPIRNMLRRRHDDESLDEEQE